MRAEFKGAQTLLAIQQALAHWLHAEWWPHVEWLKIVG